MKTAFAFAITLLATAASAHPGHDLPGISHWHATDVLGFALVALVAAGAAWFIRRK